MDRYSRSVLSMQPLEPCRAARAFTASPRRLGREAFSFTEVLFAVMILGIGFIMVAAMFPVAIKQTQLTVEQTAAGSLGTTAVQFISTMGHSINYQPNAAAGINWYYLQNFPATGGRVAAYSGMSYNLTSSTATPPTAPSTWFQLYPPQAFPILATPSAQQMQSTLQTMNPWSPLNPVSQGAMITPFWDTLAGNLISPTDNRYAFVPFYSRAITNLLTNTPSSTALVTVIVVHCRNTPTFTPAADLVKINSTSAPSGSNVYPPNLQGRAILVKFIWGGPMQADEVQVFPDGAGSTTMGAKVFGAPLGILPVPPPYPFLASALSNSAIFQPDMTGAVGEGAYLIVADDSQTQLHLTTPPTSPPTNLMVPSPTTGTINGFVYRIGNQVRTSPFTGQGVQNTWELQPGNDMKTARFTAFGDSVTPTVGQTSINYVRCFIVGKGYNDPANNDTSFSGPVMDVACFSSVINVQ